MRPSANDYRKIDHVHKILKPKTCEQAGNATREYQVRQNASFDPEGLVYLMEREWRKRVRFCITGIADGPGRVDQFGRRVEFSHYAVKLVFHNES